MCNGFNSDRGGCNCDVFYGDGDVVVCLKDVLSVGDEDGKLITGLVFREDGL